MIDIITVVFRDELPILKLQAESIDLYCRHMCLHTIYVVINDDSMTANDIDINWWGKYSSRVKIIHRQTWDVDYPDNGWLTQQLLKLLAAERSESEWSMILDAKTILIQSAELDRLFDDDGKLTWGYWPVIPVFERSQQIVSKLFDINLENVAGPQGIPFFFNTRTVQELILEVEQRTNKNFSKWFLEQGMVTEFILYSGYLEYRDGSLSRLYTNQFENGYGCCNICHSEVNAFDRKYQEMLKDNILTVSVHRAAWKSLSREQQKRYQDLLLSKGISTARDLL